MNVGQDIAAITQLIETYYEAAFTGDLERMRTTFHEACFVDGFFANGPWRASLDDYMAAMSAAPSAQSLGHERDCEIVSLDITGRAAFVKLRETLAGMRYVDYLVLSKLEDGWKITHKGYDSPDALPG